MNRQHTVSKLWREEYMAEHMSVDEMCLWLGYVAKGNVIPIKRCEFIINALRAAENLADSVERHIPISEDMREVWRAFDAFKVATKESED
jgi:hypothetical protein